MKFLATVKAIVKAELAQGRTVCILTENKKWFRHLMVAGVPNKPGECWIRSSANPAECKSVAFNTLIVVQHPRPDGLALISQRMAGQVHPRTITVCDHNVRSL